jgi:hypothetical protein
VVVVLPPDTIHLIMDLVEETKEEGPYKAVKDRLVAHLCLSEYERLDRLCNLPAHAVAEPQVGREVAPLCRNVLSAPS